MHDAESTDKSPDKHELLSMPDRQGESPVRDERANETIHEIQDEHQVASQADEEHAELGRVVISVFLGHGSDHTIRDPRNNVLRTILRQLLEQRRTATEAIPALPKDLDDTEAWRSLVTEELNATTNTFLIVDGLDWVTDPLDFAAVKEEVAAIVGLAPACSMRLMLVQSPTEALVPDHVVCRGTGPCYPPYATYWSCSTCVGGYLICHDCYDGASRCPDPWVNMITS